MRMRLIKAIRSGRRFARRREKFMRHAMLKTFLFPAAPVLRQGQ